MKTWICFTTTAMVAGVAAADTWRDAEDVFDRDRVTTVTLVSAASLSTAALSHVSHIAPSSAASHRPAPLISAWFDLADRVPAADLDRRWTTLGGGSVLALRTLPEGGPIVLSPRGSIDGAPGFRVPAGGLDGLAGRDLAADELEDRVVERVVPVPGVPTPSAAFLGALGLAGIGATRRR